ncbi:MAG: hypothetical protein ABEK59_03425 [Halobacteria archaeon]
MANLTARKIALVLASLTVLATFSVGVSMASPEERLNSNLDSIQKAANQNTDLVPEKLEWLVSIDGKANAYLELSDGETLEYKVDLENEKIREITPGEYRNPQVVVETDETTVRRIYSANDRKATIKEAYSSGDIDVEGRGINRITVGVAKAVSGFLR